MSAEDFDVAPEGQAVAIDSALIKARKARGNCAACTDDVVAGDRYGLLRDGTKRILCESCWTAAEWHNRQLAPAVDVVRTFNNEPVTEEQMAAALTVKPDPEAVVAEVTEEMARRAEHVEPEVDPGVAAFVAAGLLDGTMDDVVEEAPVVKVGTTREFCPSCQGRGWLGEFSNSCPACSGTGKRRDDDGPLATEPEVEVVDQVAARGGFPEHSVWNDPDRAALAVDVRKRTAATEGLLNRRRKAAAEHVDDADMFGYAKPEETPRRTWTDPETGYVYTQQSANRWTGMDTAGLDLDDITGDEILRREARHKAFEAREARLSSLPPLPPPPPPIAAPVWDAARVPLPPPPPPRAAVPLPPPPPVPAPLGVDFEALVREEVARHDRVRDLLEAAVGVAPVEVGKGQGELLDMLAPYQGLDPAGALREARHVIEQAIVNHPRSLQSTIGPSELGTECEHCLAAKLAGWEQRPDIPWLPTVGTAVHAWIERAILDLQQGKPASQRRYLTEARVVVGQVDGDDVEGSTDLVDLVAGMTVDWKVVGKTTLTAARSGPSRVYRAQQHLYARGWNHAGVKVDHVAIAYLPRNELSLASAIWWHEPYDEAFADEVLSNATRVQQRIRALETVGEDAVDAWITQLPRKRGCRDCERYNDNPESDGRNSLAGIIN